MQLQTALCIKVLQVECSVVPIILTAVGCFVLPWKLLQSLTSVFFVIDMNCGHKFVYLVMIKTYLNANEGYER